MIHVRVEAERSIKNAAARINKRNCPLGINKLILLTNAQKGAFLAKIQGL